MNNLYEKSDQEGIIERLKRLTPEAKRQWGTMDVAQMLAHCNVSMETPLGLNFPKRILIGRLIGRLMKPKYLGEKIMPKGAPTDKEYVITEQQDFENERARSIDLIGLFYNGGPSKCSTHPHPFFGKMSPMDWAILQWKHYDHHLRQFDH